MKMMLIVLLVAVSVTAAGANGPWFSGPVNYQLSATTYGTPLAPGGSTLGVKAVPGYLLGEMAYFDARLSWGAGLLDFGSWHLLSNGKDLALEAAREIRAGYLSWTEDVVAGPLVGQLWVGFPDRNRLLLHLVLINTAERPLRLVPGYSFRGSFKVGAGENVFPNLQGQDPALETLRQQRIDLRNPRFPGAVYRAVATSFVIRSTDFAPTTVKTGYRLTLTGQEQEVAPGQTFQAAIVISLAESRDELARQVPLSAYLAQKPELAYNRAMQKERAMLARFPNDVADPELFARAATGLELNLIRNEKGELVGSVPSKVRFPFWFPWDTAWQARAVAAYDPALAEEILLRLFDGLDAHGYLPVTRDADGTGFAAGRSNPPIQAWAAAFVANQDPDRVRAGAFLARLYPLLTRQARWWEANRRSERSLYFFLNRGEAGMDDSPAYGLEKTGSNFTSTTKSTADIEDVWASSAVYSMFEALASIAKKLGYPAEAVTWQAKADRLARAIDDHLWDYRHRAWYNVRRDDEGRYRFLRSKTPLLFLPATFGATRLPLRARWVIEEHILNPAEFWGPVPIPSVAWNDPAFDRANDGHYQQGQVFPPFVVFADMGLRRWGYEPESTELARRFLAMARINDIYEFHHPVTGGVGRGADGVKGSAAYHLGMSDAAVIYFLTRPAP